LGLAANWSSPTTQTIHLKKKFLVSVAVAENKYVTKPVALPTNAAT